MFLLMTLMKDVGGIPLGVFLSNSETVEVIKRGLILISQIAGEKAFYGRESPAIVMTDDSAAERRAVKELWPSCRLLLCSFHVSQSYWRWLSNGTNMIECELKQYHFNLFQKIMYAKSETTFQER